LHPKVNYVRFCVDKLSVAHETPLAWSTYRGTSLIRNSAPVGPYSRNMPMALWWY